MMELNHAMPENSTMLRAVTHITYLLPRHFIKPTNPEIEVMFTSGTKPENNCHSYISLLS
jgi:hypothetical protein